jgi:predicted aminopeptidase
MIKRFRFTFKNILFIFLFCILALAILNYALVIYGYKQLKGQLHIINNTRPIREMLADANVPDSTKFKLNYIEKVKRFAIDSLKLKASENYTTFYDQEQKPILWTLTASEPYAIKPYLWWFPFLGNVSYKGYFDYDIGRQEELDLIQKGYDTELGEVSAWSTLGWFKDPILSSMLRRNKGLLAELIIHEMTHSTLYLKSNVDLNENLASVCGEEGAIRFLTSTYGEDSEELKEYLYKKEDYDKFSDIMLKGTHQLDSLYKSLKDSLVIIKQTEKEKMIRKIVQVLDTTTFHSKKKFKNYFHDKLPNNAYFLGFVRYDAQKDSMKVILKQKFDGNVKLFIDSTAARFR